jgi:hypothetical protein
MKPRPETFEKLDHFCRFSWFCKVGSPLNGNFTPVANWSEVKRRVSSNRWEHLQEFFHYRTFVNPLQQGPRKGQPVREIFADPELSSGLHQLLLNIHKKVERYDWPSDCWTPFGPITQSVRRDIVHALWEAEYSDLTSRTPFSEMREQIYRDGHMVAGWDGCYPSRNGRDQEGWLPEGKLRVF